MSHHSSFLIRHSLLFLLALATVGCARKDVEQYYGQRQGPGASKSVNGTSVLGKMFEDAGHAVFSWSSLSPRVRERADVIVWFPNDFKPPSEDVRYWLEEWLEEAPGRTLIYVGRDFDALSFYWDKVQPSAPQDQVEEVRRRKAEAWSDFRLARNDVPESEDCEWFTVEKKYRPRKVRTLEGEPDWVEGIDPEGLEIELSGRVLPSPYADVVLASEGDMLVSVEPWYESQALVVANGSFLLNVPLVNHEHRKLAVKLIESVGPPRKTVIFLESISGGPTIHEGNASDEEPLDWRFIWILLHFAVVGIILCFSRWPIFGRPADPEPPARSDFGLHVEALGELLSRSEDSEYAAARLAHCQQTLHPDGAARDEPQNPKP